MKPTGYLTNPGWFRLYSVHLKAGNPASSPADSTTRRTECTSLRTTLNNQITTVVGTNFLIGGDTNFYGTWEGGYQRLIESQLDNDGRCFDYLNMPGTWNSTAYRFNHTQSPRASSGGMDRRAAKCSNAARAAVASSRISPPRKDSAPRRPRSGQIGPRSPDAACSTA